jgi:hypothetical protein
MTIARQVVPGRTYLITRVITQRQFLLRPDQRAVQIFLYCLAEAVERFNITLYGFIAESNHEHLVLRDNLANFPEFLAHFHKMVAKAMNVRLRRRENFWASEQPNAVHLVEAQDRFAKLVYTLTNPVKDLLVERVSDWPGASSLALNLSGRTLRIKRPLGFFTDKSKMPAEVTLRVHRPEGYESLTEAEWTTKLEAALRAVEDLMKEKRAKTGKQVLGRKAVLRARPTDTPQSVRKRRERHPFIACRDPRQRAIAFAALINFRRARKEALCRYHAAERDVLFPYGTYRVSGYFESHPPPQELAA